MQYLPQFVGVICSYALNMPLEPIYQCVRSKRGNDLLYEMGVKTLGLDPQLNYVPWININDVHTNENQFEAERVDLVQLVCKNYKGCGRPSICINQDDDSCNEIKTTLTIENKGSTNRLNFFLCSSVILKHFLNRFY